jgi:hypothetical protein
MTVDNTDVQFWLEWAGARLIAMPEPRIKPAEPKVIWPEYNQDSREITNFRGRLSLRAAAPAKHEVAMVDKILLLPNVCALPNVRRVLHVRALVHPINYRHLYSWVRISKLLQTSPYIVKSWHRKGLNEVVTRTTPALLCEIKAFMGDNQG